jgi:hypothetical protein
LASAGDEHRAHRLQPIDHVAIVDDLVTHIDRRAELLDGALDDLDSAIDPGAKAARAGQHERDRATNRRRDGRMGVHGAETSLSELPAPGVCGVATSRICLYQAA